MSSDDCTSESEAQFTSDDDESYTEGMELYSSEDDEDMSDDDTGRELKPKEILRIIKADVSTKLPKEVRATIELENDILADFVNRAKNVSWENGAVKRLRACGKDFWAHAMETVGDYVVERKKLIAKATK